MLLQVDDGTGAELLPGAEWYEDALAAASAELVRGEARTMSIGVGRPSARNGSALVQFGCAMMPTRKPCDSSRRPMIGSFIDHSPG